MKRRRKDDVVVAVTVPMDFSAVLAMSRLTNIRLRAAVMEREFVNAKLIGLTDAETKEEFFGFSPIDVKAIRYKGAGVGPFFALRNGRVFDNAGQPRTP